MAEAVSFYRTDKSLSRLILIQTMTNAKRILITTESREIFIVRINGKSNVWGFCEICAAETEMLTLDESVCAAGKSARELIHQIESSAIHSLETASGHLLVCQNSLGDFLQGEMK